jgi:hypothetical protein
VLLDDTALACASVACSLVTVYRCKGHSAGGIAALRPWACLATLACVSHRAAGALADLHPVPFQHVEPLLHNTTPAGCTAGHCVLLRGVTHLQQDTVLHALCHAILCCSGMQHGVRCRASPYADWQEVVVVNTQVRKVGFSPQSRSRSGCKWAGGQRQLLICLYCQDGRPQAN